MGVQSLAGCLSVALLGYLAVMAMAVGVGKWRAKRRRTPR